MKTKITRDTTVSTSELAAVLGVTGRYIRQLAEDGVLHKVQQGVFPLTDSVQAYIANLSRRSLRDDNDLARSRLSADVRAKNAKAEIAELQAQELRGKMHRSEDVEALTEDLVYTIRGALLALPGRLAVDCAAAQTAPEASDVIRKEVYKVMRELAAYHYDPKKYEERVRGRMTFDTPIEDADV